MSYHDSRISGARHHGRALVDGAAYIRLWGEEVRVAAKVHTIGGLSAHADQQDLIDWYKGFHGHPELVLVHGERNAQEALVQKLSKDLGIRAQIADRERSWTSMHSHNGAADALT